MNELEENVKAVEDGIVDLDLLVTDKDYTLDKLENAIHDLEAGKIPGGSQTRSLDGTGMGGENGENIRRSCYAPDRQAVYG